MLRSRLSGCYLNALDAHRQVPFSAALREAQRNIGKSRQRLEADQLLGLKKIVGHAVATVSAYRNAISDQRINSAHDLNDLLDRLPLLSKSQLVADLDAYQSSGHRGRRFVGSTSGSTGHSLVFLYDAQHAAWSEACKWRGRYWWGGRRGDRSLVLWGRPLVDEKHRRMAQEIKSWLRNEAHFNTFESLNDEFLGRVVECARRVKPRYLYGYGSSLAALALFMKRNGIFLGSAHAPLFIQYTADHMSEFERDIAREVLSAPVISDYGASEVPGIALQCREGRMHVSTDACIVEIVTREGARAATGTPGEIVVTALHNHAMPLIRYRIGDIGRFDPEPCPCGNAMPVMELISGKAVDLITTSHVANVSAHYLDYINIKLMRNGFTGIAQFQLVQDGRDSFQLRVVPSGLGDMGLSVRMFCDEIASKLGPVEIDVKVVSEIPVEASGKRRYFVNRVDSQFLRSLDGQLGGEVC